VGAVRTAESNRHCVPHDLRHKAPNNCKFNEIYPSRDVYARERLRLCTSPTGFYPSEFLLSRPMFGEFPQTISLHEHDIQNISFCNRSVSALIMQNGDIKIDFLHQRIRDYRTHGSVLVFCTIIYRRKIQIVPKRRSSKVKDS